MKQIIITLTLLLGSIFMNINTYAIVDKSDDISKTFTLESFKFKSNPGICWDNGSLNPNKINDQRNARVTIGTGQYSWKNRCKNPKYKLAINQEPIFCSTLGSRISAPKSKVIFGKLGKTIDNKTLTRIDGGGMIFLNSKQSNNVKTQCGLDVSPVALIFPDNHNACYTTQITQNNIRVHLNNCILKQGKNPVVDCQYLTITQKSDPTIIKACSIHKKT